MRFYRVVFRWVHYAWTFVLEGDGGWTGIRLLLFGGLLLGLTALGRCLEPFQTGGLLPTLLPPSLAQIPLVPPYTMADLVAWGLSLLWPRYWLAPVTALVWGLTLGALYLQDAFKFEKFGQALNYLTASLFGSGYPTLTVMDGRTVVPQDEVNTLQSIGGPGYLEVRPGNVVLLERGAGPTNVYGAGRYFIRRFETVREIMDLREIYRKRDAVEATTKDGIAITLRNVEATFRIDTGRQPQRTEIEPYPFAIKAVRAATYGRGVDKDGNVIDWGNLIMVLVTARILAWISHQRLDRLTAPIEDDPRVALRAEFETPEFRRLLSHFGAELVHVNIGHLDTPGAVDSQRLDNWQSFWLSQDKLALAQGEALQLAYEELGRAEGQAEMLKTIAKALDAASPGAPPGEAETSQLVILRISQLLETMTTHDETPEPKAALDSEAAAG
jgi:hypothetical protein